MGNGEEVRGKGKRERDKVGRARHDPYPFLFTPYPLPFFRSRLMPAIARGIAGDGPFDARCSVGGGRNKTTIPILAD